MLSYLNTFFVILEIPSLLQITSDLRKHVEQLKANTCSATSVNQQSPTQEWLSQSPSSSTSADTDDVECDLVSFPQTVQVHIN